MSDCKSLSNWLKYLLKRGSIVGSIFLKKNGREIFLVSISYNFIYLNIIVMGNCLEPKNKSVKDPVEKSNKENDSEVNLLKVENLSVE